METEIKIRKNEIRIKEGDLEMILFKNGYVIMRSLDILDEEEKRYLKAVIKPFRDKVKGIVKEECLGKHYIAIDIKDDSSIDLPVFNKNSMYKNMKTSKLYSLEELGL